jgi:hypothetical protein
MRGETALKVPSHRDPAGGCGLCAELHQGEIPRTRRGGLRCTLQGSRRWSGARPPPICPSGSCGPRCALEPQKRCHKCHDGADPVERPLAVELPERVPCHRTAVAMRDDMHPLPSPPDFAQTAGELATGSAAVALQVRALPVEHLAPPVDAEAGRQVSLHRLPQRASGLPPRSPSSASAALPVPWMMSTRSSAGRASSGGDSASTGLGSCSHTTTSSPESPGPRRHPANASTKADTTNASRETETNRYAGLSSVVPLITSTNRKAISAASPNPTPRTPVAILAGRGSGRPTHTPERSRPPSIHGRTTAYPCAHPVCRSETLPRNPVLLYQGNARASAYRRTQADRSVNSLRSQGLAAGIRFGGSRMEIVGFIAFLYPVAHSILKPAPPAMPSWPDGSHGDARGPPLRRQRPALPPSACSGFAAHVLAGRIPQDEGAARQHLLRRRGS